jgi:hypothetical protein
LYHLVTSIQMDYLTVVLLLKLEDLHTINENEVVSFYYP